jgi:hypothetical protein
MLEHIFRNVNDIRVFDAMVEFVLEGDEKHIDEIPDESIERDVIDADEIMDLLDYNEYKRIEIEDSIDHLVRQKILCVRKIKMEGTTGCKICKYADKLHVPRIGEHKTHVAEETSIGHMNNYYMKMNEITNALRSAAFAHIFLTLEDEIEGGKYE